MKMAEIKPCFLCGSTDIDAREVYVRGEGLSCSWPFLARVICLYCMNEVYAPGIEDEALQNAINIWNGIMTEHELKMLGRKMSGTLYKRLQQHYGRLAMGGHITMPDELDYTYHDLAFIAGNGEKITFEQFIDWAAKYLERPHQLRLFKMEY